VAALDPGARFPSLTLRDEQGAPLPPPSGETLYVVFKTTCPTCELTWPYLDRLRKRAEGSALGVLAVSQDEPEEAAEFASRLGTHIPTAFDPEPWPASEALGLSSVPTFIRVGPSGVVEESAVGFDRARLESFAARADSLAGRPPSPLFTPQDSAPDIRPG